MLNYDELQGNQLKAIIDISNKCNLRCKMCHFSYDKVFYRKSIFMKPADFSDIAKQVLPFAHTLVLSAGSEPTTSPHFGEIIKIAGQYKLENLLFLTNATLFTRKLCQTIIDNGVTQIDISIDGATKETYEYVRRGATFEKLTKNIKMLTQMKKEQGSLLPRLQFNVTLMRSNLDELPEFVALAESLGVERIGCRHLMPYADLDMQDESLMHHPEEANEGFRRFLTAADASNHVSVITFPDFFETTQAINVSALNIPTQSKLTDTPNPYDNELASNIYDISYLEDLGTQDLRPIGDVDSPENLATTVANTITFKGWALDKYGITNVHVFVSKPGANENASEEYLLKVGDTKSLNGSRPDISSVYPEYLNKNSAGWEFEFNFSNSPIEECDTLKFSFIAENLCGFSTLLGEKTVTFDKNKKEAPHLFCMRPFTSIYIDTNGDVYPYPDCRPDQPYGNLMEQSTAFKDVWKNDYFQTLRKNIAQKTPPKMCISCPDFINRSVDDNAFFDNRDIVDRYKTEYKKRKPKQLAKQL